MLDKKVYIGRCARKISNKRWNEHKKDSNNPKYPLHRAIKKHGVNNFKFEIIEACIPKAELADKEIRYIQYYDCFAPKGYNLAAPLEMTELSPEFREKASTSQQGRKKKPNSTSSYIGVYSRRKIWTAVIAKNKIDYGSNFKSEIEAATCYDKMALHLYGKDAIINFPEKKEEYLLQDLKKYIEEISKDSKTSKYIGVHFCEPIKRWKGVVNIKGTTRVKITDSEIIAAEFVDVVNWVYHKIDTFNFPEKAEKYKKLSVEWLEKTQNSKDGVGVTYNKRRKKFIGRVGLNGYYHNCGAFKTTEECHIAVKNKKKELGILWEI
jgi:group I intron endonuclease